ncbi:MAG: sigma-70 family RNA polymerase sigma factor [Verrucomicrobiota bacterium]
MDTVAIDGLLDRLRRGDQQALAELFALYREQLKRMVDLRLDHRLAGRVSASDVLQDGYIDALKRLQHYFDKPNMPFHVWLRLIIGQRLVEVHRQHLGAQMRDAGQEVSMDHGLTAASSLCLAARLAGSLPSPSQAAIRAERLAQLEKALDVMDPIDREVLALRHFEELNNNEVAEILGIQKSAASKRYVRALARLKEILSQWPGFLETNCR